MSHTSTRLIVKRHASTLRSFCTAPLQFLDRRPFSLVSHGFRWGNSGGEIRFADLKSPFRVPMSELAHSSTAFRPVTTVWLADATPDSSLVRNHPVNHVDNANLGLGKSPLPHAHPCASRIIERGVGVKRIVDEIMGSYGRNF